MARSIQAPIAKIENLELHSDNTKLESDEDVTHISIKNQKAHPEEEFNEKK